MENTTSEEQAERDALLKFLAMQEDVALKLASHKNSYDSLLNAQLMASRALRDFLSFRESRR